MLLLRQDIFSQESIDLLKRSGINFENLPNKGIKMEKFGEMLISSGLILNEEIRWISFHGAYDFAYLLKVITNQQLPEKEKGFLELMETYFPTYYDVRYLVKNHFRGGLSKLAQELEIARIGSQHQAGSDSVLTSEIYFKMKNQIFRDLPGQNILYGLGEGSDDIENSKISSSLSDPNTFQVGANNFPSYYGFDVNPFYGYMYPNNVNRGYTTGYNNYPFQGAAGYNVQNYNMNPNEYAQKNKK